MGRPPLPVGTFGKIGFVQLPSGEVQARARFRDFDGHTRLVSKGRAIEDRRRAFAVLMLRARPRTLDHQTVFTAPVAGGLRDPDNVSGDLRQQLDSIDCEVCARAGFQLEPDGSFRLGARGQRLRCAEGPWSWGTSHTLGKTVATRLAEAGFTARPVAVLNRWGSAGRAGLFLFLREDPAQHLAASVGVRGGDSWWRNAPTPSAALMANLHPCHP